MINLDETVILRQQFTRLGEQTTLAAYGASLILTRWSSNGEQLETKTFITSAVANDTFKRWAGPDLDLE